MPLLRTATKTDSIEDSLFKESEFFPPLPPLVCDLKPSSNLLTVFEDCHNHIYANEGMLKEKIFHEIVKLLLMKFVDEQGPAAQRTEFAITSKEYQAVLQRDGGGFIARMNALFLNIKREHSRLLGSDSGLALNPLTLAHVVGRLQHLSLSKTPGDIKGEAFQAFVNRHQRGDRGEFFTPHPMVRLGVEIIDPQPNEIVTDPACGSGGFLIQTIAHMARLSLDAGWDKGAYVRTRIRGVEFNPDIAQTAMVRFAFEGGSGKEVLCANALGNDLENMMGSVDVILTNPPFGSRGKVEDPAILKLYELAHKWVRSSEGIWKKTDAMLSAQTPDVLFLERCMALLRPSGRMGIVLPDGLLQNVSSGYIRAWLRKHAIILGVVSIPQEAFVPYGTGIKTSVLFVQRLPSVSQCHCFMARVRRLGYDVKGQPVYKKDDDGTVVKDKAGRPMIDEDITDIATQYSALKAGHQLNECDDVFSIFSDWLNSRLDVEHYLPSDRLMVEKLAKSGAKRLGDLAEIVSESDDFRLSGDENIRYIAISDIDARTLQVVSQQTMRAHQAPSRATYRIRQDDIITAVSGASTGTPKHATALISTEEDGAICSTGLAVLRNVRGVDTLFLLCYLRTEFFLRQVRRLMTGHAIPCISLEDLANVLVPVPSEAHQERIAQSARQVLALRRKAQIAGEELVSQVESWDWGQL